MSPETHAAGELEDGFLENYDLLNPTHTSLVPDWEDIGIADPFPSEDNQYESTFKVPETVDQFIYADSRLSASCSPICIFIPDKQVLWKMMRSCIYVTDPKDLWIN